MKRSYNILIAVAITTCILKVGYDYTQFRNLKNSMTTTTSAVRLIEIATKYSELMIVEQLAKSIDSNYTLDSMQGSMEEILDGNKIAGDDKLGETITELDTKIYKELNSLNTLKSDSTAEQIDGINTSIQSKEKEITEINSKLCDVISLIDNMTFSDYEFKGGHRQISEHMSGLMDKVMH